MSAPKLYKLSISHFSVQPQLVINYAKPVISTSFTFTRKLSPSSVSSTPNDINLFSIRSYSTSIRINNKSENINKSDTRTPPEGISNTKHSNDEGTIDPELLELLRTYPTTEESWMTPYNVLGFKNQDDFERCKLKNRFYKLAKLYHPDSRAYIGSQLHSQTTGYHQVNQKFQLFNIFNNKPNRVPSGDANENGNGNQNSKNVLTEKIKEERFKKVLAAYTLLKHPRTKTNYDKYGIGWQDNSSSVLRTPESANGNQTQSSYSSYSTTQRETGTWEDYYKPKYERTYGFNGDDNWKTVKKDGNDDGNEPSLYEQLDANRSSVLMALGMTGLVYVALQIAHRTLYDDSSADSYAAFMRDDNDVVNGYGKKLGNRK
ncbi:unnamed protein product [Ambrosiozyma monospora]|uniref:Unnamed protein product n=1 Tax=Ambrosiozyma monospora TaxID=43982 RepID=A0A9W7DIJ8_AMBMO|nr:unnamed protein product [Ambrosiozyma monospora]